MPKTSMIDYRNNHCEAFLLPRIKLWQVFSPLGDMRTASQG